MVVMWISEVITERGIGQGASLVIFLNIVSTLPTNPWAQPLRQLRPVNGPHVLGIIVLVLVFLVTIVGIIFVQEGARAFRSSAPNVRSVAPAFCHPVRATYR